jgi:hypothetical protein
VPPQNAPLELVASPGVSVEEDQLPLEQLAETVLTLIQEDPEKQKPGNTITVETEPFSMPDFSGMSLREVVQRSAGLGLRLKVSGSGVVVAQNPPARSKVAKGRVCEVFFSSNSKDASSGVALYSDGSVPAGAP